MDRENEMWELLREMEAMLQQLDEIDLKTIDKSLDSVHQLLQDLENQQPRLAALQGEIQQLLLMPCTPEETQLLTQKIQQLSDTVKVSSSSSVESLLFYSTDDVPS